LLRGGTFPLSYVYPKGMRETRDLLRRRMYLVHQRGALTTHVQILNSRVFAAQVGKNGYHCFRCGACGNALDLWAALTRQRWYDAVLDLCRRLGRPVPWLPRKPAPRTHQEATMPEP
jgi:hypothetical protein